MGNLQIFDNKEFGSIRTMNIDGTVWFVGKDIAEILGYANASKAVLTHVSDEDKEFVMLDIADSQNGNVPIGKSKTAIINESGLYSLVLFSKLESAKRFKHWVTSEVLPSIRKHGMYAVDELVNNPDLLIKVASELKAEREKNNLLKQKVEQDKPLVDFAVHVSQSKDTIGMEEMAKIARDENINIGRNRLIKWLKEKKILQNNNTPYQTYIERGYFEVIEVKKDTVYGTRVFPKTVITGKGQIWIVEKLRAEYQK